MIMEYIVFAAAIGCLVMLIYVQGKVAEKKQQKWFIRKLQESFGKPPDKEVKPERLVRLGAFYEKHPQEGQLDDITWNDLNMDAVFKRMDYTYSSTGQEYLYYLLRSPNRELEELKYLDQVVDYYMKNEKERQTLQCLMNDLGSTGKYSLYDYLDFLDAVGSCSNKKELLVNALYIVFGVCMIFSAQVGLLGLLGVMLYQILTYTRMKREMEPYLTSIAYILRLTHISGKVAETGLAPCKDLVKKLERAKQKLERGAVGSSFMMYNSKKELGSGNPLELIMDYLKMLFHLDIIIFHRTIGTMRSQKWQIDALCIYMGFLDAAVSIGMYRASLEDGYCKPELAEGALSITDVYHPLLHQPVKNSIYAEKSVLLSGSNASGKSTFLRSVALAALLAETTYTVCAAAYRAPFFRLFSSMSLRDSVEGGESYYMAEIKAIKRILDERRGRDRLLCFLDEVLRGTNTVERIAASSQILKSMAQEKITCFAATHDIELTELLPEYYDNYYFSEEVDGEDVCFSYLLKKGRAATRNAIRLLQIMGYSEDIIHKANLQAEQFMKDGSWVLL